MTQHRIRVFAAVHAVQARDARLLTRRESNRLRRPPRDPLTLEFQFLQFGGRERGEEGGAGLTGALAGRFARERGRVRLSAVSRMENSNS